MWEGGFLIKTDKRDLKIIKEGRLGSQTPDLVSQERICRLWATTALFYGECEAKTRERNAFLGGYHNKLPRRNREGVQFLVLITVRR